MNGWTSLLSISLMSCTLLTTPVAAQEDATATTEDAAATADDTATTTEDAAATTDDATATADGTATTAEAGAAEAGPAQANFQDVFTQWKDVLVQLRDLQTKFDVAEESAMAGLQDQWKAKLDEGRALIPTVRKAAEAAYRESPNSDRELTKFLIELVTDDIRADNFEAAGEFVQALVEGNCIERGTDNMAGIAAFGVNDFARAEKHLTAAEDTNSLTKSGTDFLGNLRDHPNLAELWEAELKLREAEAEADDLPRVKIETTAGDFVVELFENEAPETVGNFVNLVEKGFYDDLTFHRVIHSFMAQGGCPLGTGLGGPGYKIYCECVNENHRNHFRGSLSMAKSAARNTGGSQFFINFAPTPHLNGQHTVFGRVIEGMENLSKILKIESVDANAPTTKIIKAEVIRKREHEYQANKVQ